MTNAALDILTAQTIDNAIMAVLEPADPADMEAIGMVPHRATVANEAVGEAATTPIDEVQLPAGSEKEGKGISLATQIVAKRAGLLPMVQQEIAADLAGELIQETSTDVS